MTTNAIENSESDLLETAGKAFWSLSAHCNLTLAESAILIGVSESNETEIVELSRAKIIPIEALTRVGHLLDIHKSMCIMYPENKEIVYAWMKTPWRDLGGNTPLEFINSQVPILREFALVDLRQRLNRERGGGPF